MKVNMYQCENCQKRCANHYAEKFWINIQGVKSISQSKGFHDGSSYTTWYKRFHQEEAHFCGWKCFKTFIRSAK